MDQRDPFPRRTATVARLLPWLAELGMTLPGLAASYRPGGPLDPRVRESVILAVTEVNGCRYCAWIHGGWQDYLGDTDRGQADEAVLTYARACAEAGRPLDPSPLADVLPVASLGALRATVAQIEVSNLVGNTVDGLIARLTRKRPFAPLTTVQELGAVGAAIPLAIPLLGASALLRTVERLAPSLPPVEMPPAGEANLLAHLIAQVLPQYLANAGVRLAVLNLPVSLAIGIKAGRTAATLRLGRGRLAVENGLASDAALVLEGEVEALLRVATGSVVRQLGELRVRRP
jgi:alkylhydroperoxidase family enzyme